MIAVAGQELLYYISDEHCLYTTNIVTCDLWHVTSTLKRTITKSTLIWVAVLCALRWRFMLGACVTSTHLTQMCLLVVRSENPSKLHHYITHSHVNDFSKETKDHLVRSSHFWTRLISFYQVFYYDGHVISCNILSTALVLSMRYMYIHMSSLSIIACKLLQHEKHCNTMGIAAQQNGKNIATQ